MRADTAGTAGLAWHLHGHQLRYSLGLEIDARVREAILGLPEGVWQPTAEPDGSLRPGAQVCELTGWIDLKGWPPGTRAICRRERAHPGVQLRTAARIVRHARRLTLRLQRTWPWATALASAFARLRALPLRC